MQAFVVAVLIKVLSDPEVQASIKKILGQLITEQLLPLLPVATAAAAKAAVDQIVEKMPGLEGVVDAVKVADDARGALNDIIPNIDFGPLDNLFDFWRPKQ